MLWEAEYANLLKIPILRRFTSHNWSLMIGASLIVSPVLQAVRQLAGKQERNLPYSALSWRQYGTGFRREKPLAPWYPWSRSTDQGHNLCCGLIVQRFLLYWRHDLLQYWQLDPCEQQRSELFRWHYTDCYAWYSSCFFVPCWNLLSQSSIKWVGVGIQDDWGKIKMGISPADVKHFVDSYENGIIAEENGSMPRKCANSGKTEHLFRLIGIPNK